MIDCNQISLMFARCTVRSLLLIDEFGKGTNTIDGVSLVASTINTLKSKKQHCPKVLICKYTKNDNIQST